MIKKKKEEKAKANSSSIKILEKLAEELLSQVGVKAKPEITEDKDNDAFLVNIKGETETGLLIGARGKTLSSLQMVLGLLYRQKTGEWKRIVLNVSDYREKEEERLKELALQSAERAKSSGESQHLYNLTPSQRRTIHLYLSEDSEIETESEGEGSDRYLVVTAKK